MEDQIKNANVLLFEKKLSAIKDMLKSYQAKGSLLPNQVEGVKNFLSIKTPQYEDFVKLIPTVNKKDIFGNSEFVTGLLKERSSFKVIPAAGTMSDLLSFRIANKDFDLKPFQRFSEQMKVLWGISDKNTVVLNCYPTGIRIPSVFKSFEIGSKLEVLRLTLELLRNSEFEAVIIGQPHFLKAFLDNPDLDASLLEKTRFILGGSWFPRSLIKRISLRLNRDIEDIERRCVSLFGVAELGLNIGVQNPQLGIFRQMLNPSLQKEFAVSKTNAVPMFFVLDKSRYFLESIEGFLYITPLEATEIPTIRYATGDIGKLYAPEEFSSLSSLHSMPSFVFSLEGRKPVDYNSFPIHADELEEAILSCSELSEYLTGSFTVNSEGVILYTHMEEELPQTIKNHISQLIGKDGKFKIEFVPKVKQKGQLDLLRKPVFYEK